MSRHYCGSEEEAGRGEGGGDWGREEKAPAGAVTAGAVGKYR